MTLARRVAALETALTPTQLVVRWLAEAHSHGSLTAYVRAILDDDPEAFPLNRLCREASAGARAGVRSRVREQTDAAVRTALRETVFRFELVMRINVCAHELIDREVLVHAALAGQLAMLATARGPQRHADPAHSQRLAFCRDLAAGRETELRAAQEARGLAEARYLEGHPALFPEAVRFWDEQVHATEQLAALADSLAELDGASPPEADVSDAVAARVLEVLADLVEPAKVTALEKLGEGEKAIRIATDWLRTKALELDRVTAPTDRQAPKRSVDRA